jgi:hypothetical protein
VERVCVCVCVCLCGGEGRKGGRGGFFLMVCVFVSVWITVALRDGR